MESKAGAECWQRSGEPCREEYLWEVLLVRREVVGKLIGESGANRLR